MKNFKKLMALLIAATMIMGSMSLGVFADDAPYDNQLIISGLDQGDVVHFYQVLEWEKAGETNNVIPNSIGGWKYKTPFIPASNSPYSIPVSDIYTKGISSEMAGVFARLATSGEITSITEAQRTAGTDGKVTVTPPAAGLYMAIITPANVDTVYNPVFVAADFNLTNATKSKEIAMSTADYATTPATVAAAKKSKLEIKKSATTSEDNWDDKKPGTVAIGDTVSYTVNTTIPGFGEVYTDPTFVMTDTLNGLKLTDVASMEVKVDGVPVTAGATTYTNDAANDATTYTITFAKEYLKTITAPKSLEVTYKALVTTTAPSNVNTETNEVEIKYSHNPNDQSGGKYDLKAKKDTTQHYTFTIDANTIFETTSRVGESGSELVKVGLESDGVTPINSTIWTSSNVTEGAKQVSPLSGAKFKLYTDANCTNEYVPKKSSDGTAGTALNIVSDAAGRLNIPGLDAGTYYLREEEAPAGFIRDTTAVKIVIDATIEEEDITEYYKVDPATGDVDWKDVETAGYTPFTYKTEVLKSYKVLVGDPGVEAAKHTFVNTSESGNDIVWKSSAEGTGTKEDPQPLKNKRGVELPSTGGIGTTIFYAGGALLVLLAGVLLVSKRRIA